MTPKESRSKLTAEYLRSVMNFNPETGALSWRDDLPVRKGRTLNGRTVGTIVWPGYVSLKVDGTLYYAHRLAWLYVYGKWPHGVVDHNRRRQGK